MGEFEDEMLERACSSSNMAEIMDEMTVLCSSSKEMRVFEDE